MCLAAEKLNPIAPTPLRPASSYVGGLPHACQIGGWGFLYGLGRTFRAGTLKETPSYEYSVCRHIFRSSGRTSSSIPSVSSVYSMAKPVTSDAPAEEGGMGEEPELHKARILELVLLARDPEDASPQGCWLETETTSPVI